MPQDALTDLPDRTQFLADLVRCIQGSPSGEGFLGLVILEVRHLRELNLELGYACGDDLLRALAGQIQGCLRQSDLVYRIGGSEFALILPGLRSQAQPRMAVGKIQRVLADPIHIEGRDVHPRLSFGVSVFPTDAEDAFGLLACADVAALQARVTDRDCVHYAECAERAQPPMIELQRELDSAIRNGDLEARFQPIVDLDMGTVVSAEMISQWTSSGHGPVAAEVFREIALRSGLTVPLTLALLNTALHECQEWQSSMPHTSIALDIPANLMSEPTLPVLVARAVSLWGIDPSQLVLEITESAMMSDPKTSLEILKKLHGEGVGIAIDDFGTGYSSLSYLKDLPVSKLKIHQSFVRDMITSEPDKRIVQAIIDLAHNFDLAVIADGIRDEETLDTLTMMGCEHAQGSFVAPPMSAEELLCWSRDAPWDVALD